MKRKAFPRLMICGTHSGCGKTTVTGAILQALRQRGISLAPYKCGPDYIDPMFHQRITGNVSVNLDGVFLDAQKMREIFAWHMRGKEIITKLIIPGAIAMIICLIVHPMCMNGEILDWRKLLLFVGIPFGIQKMFLLVVPRNVGTGEMLGLVVLKLMVGSLIGIGVLAWRLLAVAGVLLKNGISGIIWIIKRLKEMVIKNERKATGKIVL